MRPSLPRCWLAGSPWAADPANGLTPRAGSLAALRWVPQIQYRLGDNKEAIALYSRLFRLSQGGGSGGGESREVQANVLAAYVGGGRAGEIPAVMEAMRVSVPQGGGGRRGGEGGGQGGEGSEDPCPLFPYCHPPYTLTCPPCIWVPPHLPPATHHAPHTRQMHPPPPQASARDSFEVAFNAACGLVEVGQLRQAEEGLQLALRVGE